MKNFKKSVMAIAVIAMFTAASITSFAASAYNSPAEAVSGLTGKTTEQVAEERAAGKTYGTIALEAGKLEEFKAAMLEVKKEIINLRVAEGTMTQEQADAALKTIEERQATCDGTGNADGNCGLGLGFGRGQGKGQGQGAGRGRGNGGMRNGACLTQGA